MSSLIRTNRTIWKQLGITLFLRHLTTQERKECCAALLCFASCCLHEMSMRHLLCTTAWTFGHFTCWPIWLLLLSETLFPSIVSTYPNTGNLAGVVVVSDDDYCYELAKGAWLEFHYHHCWTLMNSNQVRVDETQVSDGDDWGRYILFYFILYLSFYLSTICPENAPYLNMVLS